MSVRVGVPPSDPWIDDNGIAQPRVNIWLRLTSYGWQRPQTTIDERNRVRRSQLAAWVILILLGFDAALIVASLGDPASLGVAIGVGLLLVVLAGINRTGRVAVIGAILTLLTILAIMAALLNEPGGLLLLDAIPAYDLLAVAVLIAASLWSRTAAVIVMVLNVGLIVGDFYLQPHAPDLTHDLQVNFSSTTGGILAILLRPIALQILVMAISVLWVSGTEQAILRADRAEELASMEHRMLEQRRELDYGIQQILQTHIRVANGDFGARAPLTQDNILFQIASSLNNLLNRLGRAAQSEYALRRTTQEIERLRESLLAARAGRSPLWPAHSGTPVDRLIEVVAGPGRAGALQPPSAAMPDMSGMPAMPSGPGMAPFPTFGPYGAATSGPLGSGGAGMMRDTDRYPGGYAPPAPQSVPRWQQPNAQPYGGPQIPYQPAPQANPWETQAPAPNHPTSAEQRQGEPPIADAWGMPPLPDVPD